jgi:hypothetical protein
MVWYSLMIPLVLSGASYFIWRRKITWWEIFIPPIICLIAVLISYHTIKYRSLKDVEYNGYIIQEARYYEYWSTWVDATCTETYACGSDANGNTMYCTRTYDCSYCDENSAYWTAIDNGGNEFTISKGKYDELTSKWKATPTFHELNRSIHKHGSCGKDGNMYNVRWNGEVLTSEASTIERPFENIVKVSHSAFNYPDITDKQAKMLGLYTYPQFYDYYKQNAILGLDSFKVFGKRDIQTYFEYLNGDLGLRNKVKVFTLLFKNKPIDIAFKQEAYWDGGNQNELVVCIGMNDKLEIEWVKPFTWCDNKRICVDIREDISELKTFQYKPVYELYRQAISKHFHYKSFKDFNYLTFEPTFNQLLFIYGLSLVISIVTIAWCIKNQIEDE